MQFFYFAEEETEVQELQSHALFHTVLLWQKQTLNLGLLDPRTHHTGPHTHILLAFGYGTLTMSLNLPGSLMPQLQIEDPGSSWGLAASRPDI